MDPCPGMFWLVFHQTKSGCSLHGATEGPVGPQIFVGYVWYQNHLMWVKQCHVYHPPAITIFIGGMSTIPKWVVYGIVLITLYDYWILLG